MKRDSSLRRIFFLYPKNEGNFEPKNKQMTALATYVRDTFSLSDPQLIDEICSYFKCKTLERGEFLIQEGQTCHVMCFVKSGLLRIFAHGDGKEITQWISTPGYFTTEVASFMFQYPSRFNIQALVDCELYSIQREDYNQLAEVIPTWNQIEKRFLIHCFITLENRVFNHLSLTATERYQQFYETHKTLWNQVPLQYIASMLGMTPETFSRIRNEK